MVSSRSGPHLLFGPATLDFPLLLLPFIRSIRVSMRMTLGEPPEGPRAGLSPGSTLGSPLEPTTVPLPLTSHSFQLDHDDDGDTLNTGTAARDPDFDKTTLLLVRTPRVDLSHRSLRRNLTYVPSFLPTSRT